MASVSTNPIIDTQSSVFVVASTSITPPQYPPRWTWSSCVEFVKWFTGHQGEVWGSAIRVKPTSKQPYVGGIVLTREGSGHMAMITKIEDGILWVIEANYIPDQVSTRSLSIDSPLIRGFK